MQKVMQKWLNTHQRQIDVVSCSMSCSAQSCTLLSNLFLTWLRAQISKPLIFLIIQSYSNPLLVLDFVNFVNMVLEVHPVHPFVSCEIYHLGLSHPQRLGLLRAFISGPSRPDPIYFIQQSIKGKCVIFTAVCMDILKLIYGWRILLFLPVTWLYISSYV